MFLVKLCVVLFAFTITGTCQRDSANNTSPPMRLPSPSETGRKSAEQVAALRRQLMRDNYDYTHSDDERRQPSQRGDTAAAKIYYQKGNEYVPASEAVQTDSAEHGQDEQPVEAKQPGHNQQAVQNEQPGQDEESGQYVQHSQSGHDNKREQYGQEERRKQYDTKPKPGRTSSKQVQPEPQFEDQDQAQYEEQTFHSKPAYIDADKLTAREVNEPKYSVDRGYTDPARGDTNPDREDTYPAGGDNDPARGETEPPRHHKEPVGEPAYHPFYNRHPEAYKTNGGVAPQAKPFSDLRGDFQVQYGQNNAGVQLEQEEQAENVENHHEDQEAIDQQNTSDSQDDGSDYSESKKHSREMYDEFGHTARANRLQPSAARGPSHRGHSSMAYRDTNAPSGYNHEPQGHHYKAPPGRNQYKPSHRNRNTEQHRDRKAPLAVNISKKDLLYYMDDTQLRRNNNDMSPDEPSEEEHPQPSAGHKSPAAPRPSPTVARASPTAVRTSPTVARTSHTSPWANSVTSKPPDFPSSQHADRISFVTESPTNITYKLLTLKTGEGRRRGERRILQERRPEGVAIISLDHAPLPAFRLPRSRRQYMHDHYRYRPQPA